MKLFEIAEILKGKDNFEILTHNYPDGDCIGSGVALALALYKLGKNVRVIFTDKPGKFDYLFKALPECDFEAEYVVSVDVADEKLLGVNREKYEGGIDLCIDHHRSNIIAAEHKYVDSEAAAAGEIIFELLPLLEVEPDRDIANALYTAISTDTGCFRYINTTSKTFRIAAELLDIGCDSEYINKEMFETKTKRRLELEKQILENLVYCADGKCAIIYTTKAMTEGLSDDETEGIASIPRQIEGVKMGVTVREKENDFKISVRTNGDVDACAFCKKFGGGGHIGASGCTLKGTLESVLESLVNAAEDYL